MDFSNTNTSQGYGDYYKEINRRVEATKQGESKFFERVEQSGNDIPLERPDQKFVLFSLSTKEIPPKAINPLQPAFRIIGCFPSLNDTKEHAEFVAESNPSVSLFIDECRNWIVAPQTFDQMTDAAHIENVKTTLIKEYKARRKNDNEEFESARRGDDVQRTQKEKEDELDGVPIVKENSKSHIMRGHCDIKGQDLAVVILLPNKKTGEFLFKVMGCFEKQEEADRWVKNVVSRNITEFDIHVVSCCQWIFANRMGDDGALDHQYRSSELQNIMNRQRVAPTEVKQFEEWLAENEEQNTIRIQHDESTEVARQNVDSELS